MYFLTMLNSKKTTRLFSRLYLPFSPPDWDLSDLMRAVLYSLTRKNHIENLEKMVKEVLGPSYVMVTNLGRTALKIGLKAIGLREGAGVVLPTVICNTVIRAVLEVGCQPILADVEKDLHISVKTLNSCQSERTQAVIVPHLYGLHAPIQEIRGWAKSKGLYLIDDAAQAVGISVNGSYLGTFGDFGILSFGPFKSLSTPRGGALISDHNEIIGWAKKNVLERESVYWAIRRVLTGVVKFHWRPYYLKIYEILSRGKKKASDSYNGLWQNRIANEAFQLSDLETQLVLAVLERTLSIITRRRETSFEIWNLLKQFDKFEFIGPQDAPYTKIPIRLHESLAVEEAIRLFRSMGIETERIYRPLHLQKEYKVYASEPLPVAEENWEKVFLIPNLGTEGLVGMKRLKQAFKALSKM
jgi:dTDP-4-amino-4,6-dideoxygalactose transaminase